jgi:hypothetical protein
MNAINESFIFNLKQSVMTDSDIDTFKFLYEKSADNIVRFESIYLYDADLEQDCQIILDRSGTPIVTDYPIDYSDKKVIKYVIEFLHEIFPKKLNYSYKN